MTTDRNDVFGALHAARATHTQRVSEELSRRRFLGIKGESGIGKTVLLRQVYKNHLARGERACLVDLDGAWGVGRTAWLLYFGAACAHVGLGAMSQLRAGFDESFLPSAARRARFELFTFIDNANIATEILDGDMLDDDPELLQRAIAAFGDLAVDTTLFIDHLEAPGLASRRHPVNVQDLLWQLRGVHQRSPSLRLCICGRPHAADAAAGKGGAFYEDGLWLTLDTPLPDTWAHVADQVWGGLDPGRLDEILEITEGMPRSTVAMLAQNTSLPVAEAAWRVSIEFAGEANRCLQEARGLHRLGAHLLTVIARGRRPYAAVQKSAGTEVGRALSALHEAGLIVNRERERGHGRERGRGQWRISEPLLAPAIAGREFNAAGAAFDLDAGLDEQPDWALETGDLDPDTGQPVIVRDPRDV